MNKDLSSKYIKINELKYDVEKNSAESTGKKSFHSGKSIDSPGLSILIQKIEGN